MKKLIHIDNYESYYLDYLEGILPDSGRIAFEEFLAAHPELQLEDEELVFLDDAPELLSPLEKELLKKEENRIISAENLDYFAIGHAENMLSQTENTQLNAYVSKHPEAQKIIEIYQETRLAPHTVVYENKEDLKRKEIVFVSWRLLVAGTSAAAILILFFQLTGGSGSKEKHPNAIANSRPEKSVKGQPGKIQTQGSAIEDSQIIEEQNRVVAVKTIPAQAPEKKVFHTLKETPFAPEPEVIKNQNQLVDNTAQPHHPTILPQVNDSKQPVAPALNNDMDKAPNKDLASNNTGSSNMKNPIPGITNTISEKTNTSIDFKTGKATETEKGGFFLKIGKFEISHKASKKK
ncbi:hypothetical protein [Fluviicola sp.]|jgi:hypothetical protein|uniref:hypothetical protein n=1 Tax=Fluviicola sp. TaxID=1917219 RepID=UPI00282BC7C0|nr:hypothetical protein [Fluviicola sp.]MDR0802654.1 hypothetical protein [Fluviicola sp.]